MQQPLSPFNHPGIEQFLEIHMLFFFFFLIFKTVLAIPRVLWDLSSPTRGQTHPLGPESTES